jgi:hypothetical protein
MIIPYTTTFDRNINDNKGLYNIFFDHPDEDRYYLNFFSQPNFLDSITYSIIDNRKINQLTISRFNNFIDIIDPIILKFNTFLYFTYNSASHIFFDALRKAESLTNSDVKKQTKNALITFIKTLSSYDLSLKNLPKLCLTEDDDLSCSIEWIFDLFSVFLCFEQDKTKSFYFIISVSDFNNPEDPIKMINNDLASAVKSICNFVMNHL